MRRDFQDAGSRSAPLNIVFVGLTLSSSWGNGHATTYRALLRGLHAHGHQVLFLEREVPWYADNRDLADPDFCALRYYSDLRELRGYAPALRHADAVIIGSYVPDGTSVIDLVADLAPRLLCFYDIDTPVTLSRLEDGEEEYVRRDQLPLFDCYFSFSGGAVLDRLEDVFKVRRAAALYCSVDEARHRNTGEAFEWDLGYLGTFSEDRQPVLEKLLIEPARQLPEWRFAVAGAQYPDTIDWPSNVERIGHIPPDGHASFYSRQRFTLNVTRADMVGAGWSPSVRLFEAGACGTPVISDRWRGLPDLFPDGEAVLIADGCADVVRALTQTPEPERKRIALNARERVLAAHTGSARALELVDELHACRESRSRSRDALAV